MGVDANDRFDVVSLFTIVPVAETLTVVFHLLQIYFSLGDRSAIAVGTICSLVEPCLRSIYFQFKDHFYVQSESTAMDSPLPSIITSLYIEHSESVALKSSLLQPKLWMRYVNDTFVIIWQHGKDSHFF